MPWTFAHIAAVVPLRRIGPVRLDFPALAIGSVAPDAGYYVHAFALSTYAHTLAGALAVCVPIGFMLLCALHALRVPLLALLPQPHRAFWSAMRATPPWRGVRTLAVALLSLWIGACTHCAWDGLTHRSGWAVAQWPWLRERPFAALDLPLHGVLQHASTLAGVLVMAIAYRRCMARDRVAAMHAPEPLRHAGWMAMGAIAAAGSIALQAAHGWQRFTVFRFVVDATALFALLIAAAVVLLRCMQRRRCRSRFDTSARTAPPSR